MTYNLQDHGDKFEKDSGVFIKKFIPNYEKVWQLYIGNKGNDTKAEIPGYPGNRDGTRQKFSEHTYTILLSILSMKRIVDSDAFSKQNYGTDDLLTIHDLILLFFANLGKIRDNFCDAAVLIGVTRNTVETKLDVFWKKRNIPVHGRVLPLVVNANGTIELPKFPEFIGDSTGWNHKNDDWNNIVTIDKVEVSKMLKDTFTDFLPLVNDVYADFHQSIEKELNDRGLKIKFDYPAPIHGQMHPDSSGVVSIYGITAVSNSKGDQGSSSFAGKAGS